MSVKDNFPNLKPALLLDFANTKVLDSRITFSRASTATFYDGKTVAKAEENLVQYSQEFDNAAWNKVAATITANSTTAPDGSSTADTYTSSGSDYLNNSTAVVLPSRSVVAASIFVKYIDVQWIRLNVWSTASGGNQFRAWFDVQNGVKGTENIADGTNANIISATMQSAGNGWYRLSVTGNFTDSSTNHYLSIATASANASITRVVGSYYLWGAQLEQRSTVTAYTPTTTQPITNYIPVLQTAAANVARFDHNPVTGESLGLEIEEQRTNLLTYSEQFDNAAWGKVNGATATANQIVSPSGLLDADLLYTANAGYISQTISVTSGVSYTFSVFAKKGTVGNQLRLSRGETILGIFNLENGTVVSGSVATIQSLGNGWYRCSATETATSTSSVTFRLRSEQLDFNCYIWGAQLEAGSFATSYIPTVASQVTRSADSASMTGTNFSSWYRADEGTIYSEFSLDPLAGTYPSPWAITDNTSIGTPAPNRIQPYQNSAKTSLGLDVFANNTVQANIVVTVANMSGMTKHAASYAFNSFAASGNGGAVGTDTSGLVPQNLSQLIFGRTTANAANSIGCVIRKLAFYPKASTPTQLQALTQQG